MKALILCCALMLLLMGCTKEKDFVLLKGTWQTDSVFTYYNGFTFTRHDISGEPLHEYEGNGTLIMKRDNEKRSFSYKIASPDTLMHFKADKEVLQSFVVLEISERKLVLKKDLNPLFAGSNQSRYEIWYFSKIGL